MPIIWNEHLDELVVAASNSNTLSELADTLSEALGTPVTPNAVKKAYYRLRENCEDLPTLGQLLLATDTSPPVSSKVEELVLPKEYGKPPVPPPDRNVDAKSITSGFLISDGDNHYPIHDKYVEAAKLALMRDLRPQVHVNVGDQYDCWLISGHDKEAGRMFDPGARLQEEFDSAQDYWREIVNIVPDVHLILGNHENRLNRLIGANLGLFGLRALEWQSMAGLPPGVQVHSYGTRLRVGAMTFQHGDRIGGRFGVMHPAHYLLEKQLNRNTVFGHCFDQETELLTERGWLKRDQLRPSDRVMTLNRNTQRLEYNDIEHFHDYTGYDKMCAIKGQVVDLLVTDKHGLVHANPDGSTALFNAEDFPQRKTTTFMCCGVEDREGLPYTHDELRLIVWIAADANLDYAPTASARFHLKKKRKIERLKGLLDRLNVVYSEHQSGSGASKIRISVPAHIAVLFDWTQKQLPQRLRAANAEQAQTILDEYAVTDGSRNGKSVQISSSKEQEVDLLQALFVTSGFRATKLQRPSGNYALTVNPRPTVRLISANYSESTGHTGSVWCVSVANGTLLVRRNGKVCVTQNSHRIEVKYKTGYDELGDAHTYVAINQGHGSDVAEQKYANEPNWQHGFTVIEYWTEAGRPRFTAHPISVVNGRFSFAGKVYDGKKCM